MSDPHFTCPPIDGPKPEWVVFARKVIDAKGQVKLTPEQAYNLARETVRFCQATQGVSHFVEQLSEHGRRLGGGDDEESQSSPGS